jgi:hypothetical protein
LDDVAVMGNRYQSAAVSGEFVPRLAAVEKLGLAQPRVAATAAF